MTEQAFRRLLYFSILKNFGKMQSILPYKTGNLAMNSFKLEETKTGWRIYIDLKVAPYAVYLDSKPKTRAWWEYAARKFVAELTIDMKGVNNAKF